MAACGPLLLAAGCGLDVEAQHVEPWAQWAITFGVQPEPFVIALVVDDRPTGEAAKLRQTVAEALQTTLFVLGEQASWDDPAAWRPVDWTVVLALPSVLGSERLIGPDQVPAFLHRPRFITPESAMALADTVLAEMETRLAAPDASYRPIEAAAQLGQVLSGVRPPADEPEAALAEAGARGRFVLIGEVLATTGDDESPGAVAAYPMPSWNPRAEVLFDFTAVIPSVQPSPCLSVITSAEPPSRLRSWIELPALSSLLPIVQGWPCGAEWIVQMGLPPVLRFSIDGRHWCTSHPIAMKGPRAECLVLAESYAVDAPCDPERGWRDPMDEDGVRRPRLDRDEQGDYRTCEVTQFEGAALDACRTTSACEGCPSGWCRAEQLGLDDLGWSYDWCAMGDHPALLRFVGGAVAGAEARFRVTCNLVP